MRGWGESRNGGIVIKWSFKKKDAVSKNFIARVVYGKLKKTAIFPRIGRI